MCGDQCGNSVLSAVAEFLVWGQHFVVTGSYVNSFCLRLFLVAGPFGMCGAVVHRCRAGV